MGVKTKTCVNFCLNFGSRLRDPLIHPPLFLFFSSGFLCEKSWLEQGWLVALVMMSMLPFMGIGAAPWNEEKSLVVSEFCWRFLGDFERFLLLLGEFSFCLLVGSF